MLVIPRVRRMSPATLEALARLETSVIFEALPEDVPGLGKLEARRESFRRMLAASSWAARVHADVPGSLKSAGLVPEQAGRVPLGHIRRARDGGRDYFFVNHAAGEFSGWLQLAIPARAALLMDPLTGRTGFASVRAGEGGRASVYLQLASGESLLLRTYDVRPKTHDVAAWSYTARAGQGEPLAGPWHVEFLRGDPALPAPLQLDVLRTWTEGDDARLASFSGTARYRIEFDAPARRADAWLLDLGDVREAARVRLNGEDIGHAWSLPFALRVPGKLKSRANVLEIEVTNLPANRVRDLDRRKVDWKVMKEINLVDLRYKPFDASGWQVAPSGLLGPVQLVPLEVVRPR
jgi:hypothetical protein